MSLSFGWIRSCSGWVFYNWKTPKLQHLPCRSYIYICEGSPAQMLWLPLKPTFLCLHTWNSTGRMTSENWEGILVFVLSAFILHTLAAKPSEDFIVNCTELLKAWTNRGRSCELFRMAVYLVGAAAGYLTGGMTRWPRG